MRILFFFLFFTTSLIAQEDLSVKDGKIMWQKVYESNLSEEEIRAALRQKSSLNPIAETFAGDSKPVDMKCDQSQAIFMDDDIFFFALVEIKEGRYRVTVKNIRLVPSNTVSLWGVEDSEAPDAYEEYMIRNRDGELRKNRLAQNSRECISNYLTDLFAFKAPEKEDW